MLFGEGDTTGWNTFGAIAFGVAVAAGLFFVAWLNNGTRLLRRVDELTSQVFTLQQANIKCREEAGNFRLEIHTLTQQIRSLQQHTGMSNPTVITGSAVGDLRGIIRAYSPSLVSIFGYLPAEIIGKKIEVLIPDDIKSVHLVAFERAIHGPPILDKTVITFGLTKSGARVPITINLKSLQPEGLIYAEIRERPSDEKNGSNPQADHQ